MRSKELDRLERDGGSGGGAWGARPLPLDAIVDVSLLWMYSNSKSEVIVARAVEPTIRLFAVLKAF